MDTTQFGARPVVVPKWTVTYFGQEFAPFSAPAPYDPPDGGPPLPSTFTRDRVFHEEDLKAVRVARERAERKYAAVYGQTVAASTLLQRPPDRTSRTAARWAGMPAPQSVAHGAAVKLPALGATTTTGYRLTTVDDGIAVTTALHPIGAAPRRMPDSPYRTGYLAAAATAVADGAASARLSRTGGSSMAGTARSGGGGRSVSLATGGIRTRGLRPPPASPSP